MDRAPFTFDPPIPVASAAAELIAQGWNVIPVRAGEKRPVGDGWEKLHITRDEVSNYFHDGSNIGVLLGVPGNNRVDVDLDCREAVALAPAFLPTTGCVSGHASNPRSHYFYHVEPAPALEKLNDVNQSKLLELRSADADQGVQTLVPPSIHPNHEPYIWYGSEDPARVEATMLQRAVRRLAAATLLVRHYPAEGGRHDLALALSGFLLRNGYSADETAEFMEAVVRAAGDQEWKDREKCIQTTMTALAESTNATGGNRLREILGQGVLDRITGWLEICAGESSWPEVLPLGAALRPVSGFDPSFLPQVLRPLVADVAERMQVPPDFSAAAAVIALAGVVNRRAFIRPKAEDRSWQVYCNLWGAIIAPPGAMKSPLIEAVTKPLTRIEAQWREEYAAACTAYEPIRERQEAVRQAQREAMKQAIKRNDSAPAISIENEVQPPVQKRLLLTDATFEKLHTILLDNPAGITVVRDELTGWLADLGKHGRESERAFYLQSWNGVGGFSVDRVGRGSIHVPAVCTSLLGCLQPARVRQYLSDAVADTAGPQNDGLFQRLQVIVWPDLPQEWAIVDREPDAIALANVERVFTRLVNLPADNPVQLYFSPEAQESFYRWWTQLEQSLRAPGNRHPAMLAHLAKYRSLLPTLAALFELADLAVRHDFNPSPAHPIAVTLEHTEQAQRFVDYLWSHATRVYSCIVSRETSAAQELANRIAAGELPAMFSTRDVYRHHWSNLESPDKARPVLRYLEEMGWVRETKSESGKGHRPTQAWETNPACRKSATKGKGERAC